MGPDQSPKKSIYKLIYAFVNEWVPTQPLPNRLNEVVADFFNYYGGPVYVDTEELFYTLRKHGYTVDDKTGIVSGKRIGNYIEDKN